MRKLLALTLVLLLSVSCTALAETAYLLPNVKVELTPVSDSGRVSVTITVTAVQDMPAPCALYDPSRTRIVDFGTPTLSAGESASWSGIWALTPEQLSEGKLTFYLAYHVAGEDSVIIQKQQPYYVNLAPITAGSAPALEESVPSDLPGAVDPAITPLAGEWRLHLAELNGYPISAAQLELEGCRFLRIDTSGNAILHDLQCSLASAGDGTFLVQPQGNGAPFLLVPRSEDELELRISDLTVLRFISSRMYYRQFLNGTWEFESIEIPGIGLQAPFITDEISLTTIDIDDKCPVGMCTEPRHFTLDSLFSSHDTYVIVLAESADTFTATAPDGSHILHFRRAD